MERKGRLELALGQFREEVFLLILRARQFQSLGSDDSSREEGARQHRCAGFLKKDRKFTE